MSRFTLESLLASKHGMTDDQLATLRAAAEDINARYPGPDSGPTAEAAFVAAYQAVLLNDGAGLITSLRGELARAEDELQQAERKVGASMAALQQAARTLYRSDAFTVDELAEYTGQHAMVVQTWLR